MVVPTKSAPASAQAMAFSKLSQSAITSWSGYFALMVRMNWAEVEPSGRRAPVPCTARMSTPHSTSSSTSFMVTVMYMGVPG